MEFFTNLIFGKPKKEKSIEHFVSGQTIKSITKTLKVSAPKKQGETKKKNRPKAPAKSKGIGLHNLQKPSKRSSHKNGKRIKSKGK